MTTCRLANISLLPLLVLSATGPAAAQRVRPPAATPVPRAVQSRSLAPPAKGEIIWTDDRHGHFIDTRDNKEYLVVRIGTQTIMARNLAYKPTGGTFSVFEDKPKNLAKYGYLYDWETAKRIAPTGWHLPTKEEWELMIKTLGGVDTVFFTATKEGGSSGFNALMGGFSIDLGGAVISGANAPFWSATALGEDKAWYFNCQAITKNAYMYKDLRKLGFSVRLFQD